MTRALLAAAAAFLLLAAPAAEAAPARGRAIEAVGQSERSGAVLLADSGHRKRRGEGDINAFEIIVGLLASGAGIGAWVWMTRRPPGGSCGPGG